ncbi:universal stress protein [Litorivivens sp.]|uniref:universal stress protein n=1 Tax=Litorivivens sp. TaxID=2020868 RepID=UPI0035693A31
MRQFNSVLCIVDTEENSDEAILHSIKIAEDHQATITFVSTMDASKLWYSTEHYTYFDQSLQHLAEVKRSAIASRISEISPKVKANIEVLSGIGFLEIIRSVVTNQHDLVVKCAEDVAWLERMFGSEDMQLIRKCPCPVLMLKPGHNDSFHRILATVDINEDVDEVEEVRVQAALNNKVLEYGATMAMPELTEMHIGAAWEAYAEHFYRYGAFSRMPEEEVDRYVEQIRRERSDDLDQLVRKMETMLGKDAVSYLQPRVHLAKGKPYKEIPKMVEKYDIDLIVMGTVGRVGIPGLIIGNTAESILEQVKCSVLALKPDGFETPVR